MATASDRRPIAARETRWAMWVAARLVRRGFSANGISVFGLCCGVLAGCAVGLTRTSPGAAPLLWFAGAVLIQLRLAANMFDGMVALARGEASPLGELYNEVPDRVSDSAVLIGLGAAAGSWGLGLVAALAAIATAYIRAVGKGAGAGSDFSGPMAKQQRMFLVTALALWCALAPTEWQVAPFGFTVPGLVLIVIILGAGYTALRRLRRIAAILGGAERGG